MPTVDVFGTQAMHVCDIYWGDGNLMHKPFLSELFQKDWSGHHLLWLSPPFGLLQAVVWKILIQKLTGILILPHWKGKKWFKDIQPYVVRKYLYPKGTTMYETQDKQMPGIKYPIWALHVDGKQVDKPDCDIEMDNFDGGDDKFVKKTKSAGRRKRRALIGQVLC